MSSYINLDQRYLDANPKLCRFRKDGNFSWTVFNQLWRLISNYVNCPANDVLFQPDPVDQNKYEELIHEMVNEAIEIGLFGPQTRGLLRPDSEEGIEK